MYHKAKYISHALKDSFLLLLFLLQMTSVIKDLVPYDCSLIHIDFFYLPHFTGHSAAMLNGLTQQHSCEILQIKP